MSETSCPELCHDICEDKTSFCDCGSRTCKCREGFTGPDCSIDSCGEAECGNHGTCSFRYLGSTLASSTILLPKDYACICDNGWTGPKCDLNPCNNQEESCSGHGKCVALSIDEKMCDCDDGYSGDKCQENCNDICKGDYPYSCAPNLMGTERYGCHPEGGCSYLKMGEEYPYSGFCTFKSTSISRKRYLR